MWAVWEGDSGVCETDELCKYLPSVSFGKEVFLGQGVDREEGWWWLATLSYTLFSFFFSSLPVCATVMLPGGAS